MSDVSSSIPPECDECHEEFSTLWTINDVVNHFNKHIEMYKDAIIESWGEDT